jgi:hypothetical protein
MALIGTGDLLPGIQGSTLTRRFLEKESLDSMKPAERSPLYLYRLKL